ncbi:phage tail tape measure protein [Brevibacillus gelatini]|uniref:phage tail tape measure protein n=1 Tax=Brevibacillus gelatini TaxID=1655277 RepID=UPI001474E562|nr:phage tail tape measure protein [Brevibacillus gelatini]
MATNNNRLSILITGKLDISSTQKQITEQLNKLKKENVNLNVNFQTDKVNKLTETIRKQAINYEQWWASALLKEEKQREKVLQTEQKIRRKLEQLQLQEQQRTQKAAQDYVNWWTKALKERELKEELLFQRLSAQQQKLAANLSLFQDKANFNATRLLQNVGKHVDQKALSDWVQEVQRLTIQTPRLQQEMARLNERFRQISTTALDAKKSTFSFSEQLGHALNKIALWGTAGSIFFGAQEALKELFSTLVDIDTKLTELSKVLSSDTNFGELMRDTVELANTYGRSLTEAQDALIEFGKAGFEAEQALQMTNATLLGANVTGLQTGQMAEYLTGALVQFNISAKESTKVIDKLNEVDNNFSVTSLGLAQSIAKAGESAQSFGVTLDELIGMTTAIGQATRESGNVIGNALKTVFARLNMDKTQDALASIRVAVKDFNGELRSATDIYADVASQWNLLTRAQKTYIAEALAGKYHITRMIAMLDNWDTVMKASETSQNSLGSSMEENRKHMESLSSAINKVTAAGQELAYSIGESGLRDAMYNVLNVTSTFIKGITESLPYIFSWQTGITGLSLVVAGFIPKLAQMIPLLGSLSVAVRGLGASFLTLMANPVVLATSAIIGLGAAIVYTMGKHKEYVEELKKLDSAAKDANDRLKEIEETLRVIGSTKTEQIFDYTKTIENLDKVKVKLQELQRLQKEQDDFQRKLSRINLKYTPILLNDRLDPSKIDQELKDLAQTAGINILQFKTLEEALSAVNQKLQSMNNTAKELKNNNLSEVFDTEGKKIDELTQILERMNNKQGYTAIQAKEITDKFKDLAPALTQIGDKYYFTSDKVQELINKHKDLIKQSYDNAKIEVQEREKALIQLVNAYDKEINKIDELIIKRDQLNNSITKKVSETVITGVDGSTRKYDASEARYAALAAQHEIDKRLEDIKKSNEELEKFDKLYNGLGKASISETKPKKPTSSGAKSSTTYTPLTQDAKELLRIETELVKVQNKRQLLLDTSSAYRDNLKQEKTLQEQKLKLLIKEYEQVTKTKVLNGKIQSNKFPAKLSDDALKRAYELEQQIAQLQTQIATLSFDELSSSLKEYAEKNDYLDSKIKIIQERMVSYSKTSQIYRDAIEEENLHLKLKQDNLHEEAELIRKQLAYGQLTIAQREELNNKLIELQTSWLNLQNSIDTNKLEQANSLLNEQKNKTDELSKAIELANAKMNAVGDTTSEQYYAEYANYVRLISLKKQSLQEEISLREKLIQQNQNNIDLIRQYKMEIVDLQIEQLRLQETINQVTANKIIDTYKRVYEEQKNIAIKAIEDEEKRENERHKRKLEHIEDERKRKEDAIKKEIDAIDEAKDAENERHKAAMDALDEEMEKFNEAIDKRLQLIDRQSSEREYNNELEKLQSERQKLQQQINTLSLDDSYEAKLRLSELNEQLAAKDREIEDLNYKRSTELRKDNLEDQRDAYEKDINAKKKAEQAKYDETVKKLELEKRKLDQQLTYYKDYYDKLIKKENEKHENILAKLQKEKEETERHFNELIADEKRYADMRKAILAGNLSSMQGDLLKFEQFVKNNMAAIGNSIAQNLLAKIEESKRAIESLNNISIGVGSGSSGSSNGNSGKYAQYQSIVRDIVNAKKKWTDAHNTGDKAGEKYWADYAKPLYSQLPAELANELAKSDYDDALDLYNRYYKGKYHDGGIVDGKSDRLTEIVNKMFNLKPDEGFAKVLKGELWTTPQNIAQNFIPNLKNLMSSITPVVNLNTATGSGDTLVNINIERFTGTESDLNKFKNIVLDAVVKANKKKGR